MNEKKIYELLNNVEIDLDKIDDISEIEKERLKKNFKNINKKSDRMNKKSNRINKSIIVAGLALLIGISSQTNVGKQVYAAAKSKINDINYSINWFLGTDREIQPYSKVINQVVEDNGVKVKLTDVIVDKDELIISSLVELDNKDVDIVNFDYNIYIDGKRIDKYSSSGSFGKLDNMENIFYNLSIVDIEDVPLKDDINIDIIIKNIRTTIEEENTFKENKIKGNWEYRFNANASQLAEKTNNKVIKYSFKVDDTEFIIDELSLNPVSQKIYGHIVGDDTLKHNLILKGFDNLGNEVEFYLSKSFEKELVFRYESINKDLADNITSIELTPYASKFPEQNGKVTNDWKQVGQPFTIKIK
jgi:hypothetical protein